MNNWVDGEKHKSISVKQMNWYRPEEVVYPAFTPGHGVPPRVHIKVYVKSEIMLKGFENGVILYPFQ